MLPDDYEQPFYYRAYCIGKNPVERRPLWAILGCPDPAGHPLYEAVFDNILLDCQYAERSAGLEDWQLMAGEVAGHIARMFSG